MNSIKIREEQKQTQLVGLYVLALLYLAQQVEEDSARDEEMEVTPGQSGTEEVADD